MSQVVTTTYSLSDSTVQRSTEGQQSPYALTTASIDSLIQKNSTTTITTGCGDATGPYPTLTIVFGITTVMFLTLAVILAILLFR